MVARVIRRPSTILVLLTALNLLNYLDRFVLSAVLTKVQDDLHITNVAGGWLATVFLIGLFATSPLFGSMADRSGPGGRKRLIALGIAVWSAATVASGFARDYWTLFALRAVVGVGEASYATIAPTIIDDVAPPERKGQWQAIFFTAIPVGSALGYVLGGAVMHAYGWRSAFYVAGGPGLAIALLCLLIAEPSRGKGHARPDVLSSARTLIGLPLYRNTVLGYCAQTFALGGFAFWAPKYLHVRYGLEPGYASLRFGLITVAGGAIGTLLGGWLGDAAARARRRDAAEIDAEAATAGGNVWLCALSAGLAAPLAAAAILAPTASLFFVLVLPCEIAVFLLGGPINVALLRSVPPELRASAMALCIFAIHALGDLWSPPIMGKVADLQSMQVAMSVVPLFWAAAAIVWWRTARASARLTSTARVR
jgi:MFS family permease